LFLVKKKH